METYLRSILQDLVRIPAPPGGEQELRNFVQGELEGVGDPMRVDPLGNLILPLKRVEEDLPVIMLSAHLDEVGIIATHIDDRGFIRFTNLGGLNPGYLLGSRVRFLKETAGVISAEGSRKSKRVPDMSKLYIDVGVSSREDCPVRVGDLAVFQGPYRDAGKRVISRALDDRIGVGILMDLARRMSENRADLPHQLFFVFSVQEEVRRRGIGPAAYQLKPDLGLAVDVTSTGDTPGGKKMEVELGGGPAVKIRDQGMLADPRVVSWMIEGAQALQIPYQREILEGGTTEAANMQVSRSGVPAGCLSIPCRYVHSPSEMVDWDDVEGALKLLEDLLSRPVPLLSS